MTSLIDRYFNTLSERLEKVRTTQAGPIERAAELCAKSIAAEKLVFTFGTGHGALPALESFPRTGTIVGFRPIVESTMISFHHVWGDMGARQYRFIHAQEGYGKAILRSHQLDPGRHDAAVLAFGHQRRDHGHRDRMQGAWHLRRRRHLAAALFRHAVAPFLGQAAVRDCRRRHRHRHPAGRCRRSIIDGLESPVGASSTSVTIAVAHAIVAATAEKLVQQGIKPHVMVSPNTTGKEAANRQNDENYEQLWRRLKAR